MSEDARPAASPPKRRRRLVWIALLAVLFTTVLLTLHFAQKRHDELGFDVASTFPMSRSIVPGEAYATVLAEIMEHELSGTTGWRPNDLFLWGPTLWADNNSNRQLGIIQAVRESTRVLRDHLTKVSATEYDQNLVDADTRFRNDEFKFWFPSAESRFREGSEALRRYIEGLRAVPPTSQPINRRNVEMIRLFQIWTDLLGAAHARLYAEDIGWLDTDDTFYNAQGLAHVMYHLTLALRREYASQLQDRETLVELFEQITRSLGRAAVLKPVVVLDGRPAGLFANHRRNLDAYIVDARQLMYSVREELEK